MQKIDKILTKFVECSCLPCAGVTPNFFGSNIQLHDVRRVLVMMPSRTVRTSSLVVRASQSPTTRKEAEPQVLSFSLTHLAVGLVILAINMKIDLGMI